MAEAVPQPQPAERLTPDEVIAKQRNRQVTILSLAVVLLAGLAWLAGRGKGDETKFESVLLVAGAGTEATFKKEDVAQVEIWKGKEYPFVLRRDAGGWRVPARFNAPADKAGVESLLTKLFEAKRLGRPSTEDTGSYALYSLSDDEAAHIKLSDGAGKEFLHLLVGKGDEGGRDFIRLTGDEAPKGIFELAGSAGSWDSLYSRLHLDADGKADVKRWLDLTGFKVIEPGARIETINIADGDRVLEFSHDKKEDKKWAVTKPGSFEAEGAALEGVAGALQNLAASDIAGRDTDAGALGTADSKRVVTVEFTHDNKPVSSTLTFGLTKDGNAAVHLKSANQGTMIYWVGDYVLQRLFRKSSELIHQAGVNIVPSGRDPEKIRVRDGDKLVEAERVKDSPAKDWKLIKPVESKADRIALSNVQMLLNTLTGAKSLDKPNLNALGVDPAKSSRWLELSWAEKGEKKEGQEAPPDVQKSAALYFGKTQQGLVAMLRRVTGEDDLVFWMDPDRVSGLFVDPADYVYYEVKVRHVLISWKGKSPGMKLKEPERSEEQARGLAAKILGRAKAGEDFVALAKEFSDDGVPDTVFEVNPAANLVEPFKKLAAKLAVGGIDSCDSQFGLHIVKRIE